VSVDRLLILDCETTGLDPAEGAICIEVACTLYDVERAMPIDTFSAHIRADHNEAEAINGIPVDLLLQMWPAADVWDRLQHLFVRTDAVVAHRAEFDQQFVPAKLRYMRPWICSKYDMEWPKGASGDHLVHLALAHGVPVFTAHRALADVDTLVRTFQAASRMPGPSMQERLQRALLPRVRLVSLAPFAQKDAVKAAGFSWDGKEWSKRVVKGEPYEFPWKVREVSL
jgi:DNA polymerase-3 subunit epsilon